MQKNIEGGAENAEGQALFCLREIKKYLEKHPTNEAATFREERLRVLGIIIEAVEASGARELNSAEIKLLNETLVSFHPHNKFEAMEILNFLR